MPCHRWVDSGGESVKDSDIVQNAKALKLRDAIDAVTISVGFLYSFTLPTLKALGKFFLVELSILGGLLKAGRQGSGQCAKAVPIGVWSAGPFGLAISLTLRD